MGRLLPHYPVPVKNDDSLKMAINENFLYLATQRSKVAVKEVTATYSAAFADEVILVDTTGGNVTITLPDATRISGKMYRIKRLTGGVNTLTVAGSGASTIDGAASISMPAQWASKTLITDGTDWFTF